MQIMYIMHIMQITQITQKLIAIADALVLVVEG